MNQNSKKNIHFIAIGGAIMHQLALALQREGHQITGSDDDINDPAKSNLIAAGLMPKHTGWFTEKITNNLDAVVLGMHAKADNPELLAAQALQIPIYSFPEYVYEVSKNKKRIVIAGSHGKTSVTSMIMHVLRDQKIDFDYLVGAKVEGFNESVKLTNAPIIILEGDEYPASVIEKRPKIFFYHPHITVLNGIAWDHVNVFPTYENYFSQFETYLNMVKDEATIFYTQEDKEVVRLIELCKPAHAQSYQTPKYHYNAGNAFLETNCGIFPITVFGKHNMINLEAARKVCNELGILDENFYKSIAQFSGAARRLEKLLATENLVAYRDFAHSPSKLKATLEAVREAYAEYNLIACFELHTFSSLSENFLKEYENCMNESDSAIVYFSQHALQLKGLPILNKSVVKSYFKRADLTVIDSQPMLIDLVKKLTKETTQKTCLLLMSSGTFDGTVWSDLLH